MAGLFSPPPEKGPKKKEKERPKGLGLGSFFSWSGSSVSRSPGKPGWCTPRAGECNGNAKREYEDGGEYSDTSRTLGLGFDSSGPSSGSRYAQGAITMNGHSGREYSDPPVSLNFSGHPTGGLTGSVSTGTIGSLPGGSGTLSSPYGAQVVTVIDSASSPLSGPIRPARSSSLQHIHGHQRAQAHARQTVQREQQAHLEGIEARKTQKEDSPSHTKSAGEGVAREQYRSGISGVAVQAGPSDSELKRERARKGAYAAYQTQAQPHPIQAQSLSFNPYTQPPTTTHQARRRSPTHERSTHEQEIDYLFSPTEAESTKPIQIQKRGEQPSRHENTNYSLPPDQYRYNLSESVTEVDAKRARERAKILRDLHTQNPELDYHTGINPLLNVRNASQASQHQNLQQLSQSPTSKTPSPPKDGLAIRLSGQIYPSVDKFIREEGGRVPSASFPQTPTNRRSRRTQPCDLAHLYCGCNEQPKLSPGLYAKFRVQGGAGPEEAIDPNLTPRRKEFDYRKESVSGGSRLRTGISVEGPPSPTARLSTELVDSGVGSLESSGSEKFSRTNSTKSRTGNNIDESIVLSPKNGPPAHPIRISSKTRNYVHDTTPAEDEVLASPRTVDKREEPVKKKSPTEPYFDESREAALINKLKEDHRKAFEASPKLLEQEYHFDTETESEAGPETPSEVPESPVQLYVTEPTPPPNLDREREYQERVFQEERAYHGQLYHQTQRMIPFESGTAYTESDADDEYERSVHDSSPVLATDDEETESEGSERTSTEHTPTTYGRMRSERDQRDDVPEANIMEWTAEECADFVSSLGLRQYTDAFLDNEITGEALVALLHEDLKELGIVSVGHRLTILKAVYEIKVKQDVPIDSDHYMPLSADAELLYAPATQKDISKLIEQIRIRDERWDRVNDREAIMKQQLAQLAEENRRLREDLLPVFKMVKEAQPLPYHPPNQQGNYAQQYANTYSDPNPSQTITPPAAIPSLPPTSGGGLSRKFSTKQFYLNSTPKNASPTHLLHSGGMEQALDPASAAERAVLSSSHLAARNGGHSQTSPGLSPNMPSPSSPPHLRDKHTVSGSTLNSGSYMQTGDLRAQRGTYTGGSDAEYSGNYRLSMQPPRTSSGQSTQSILTNSSRRTATPAPSPAGDGPSLEIFKSFKVSMDDPCWKVLPAALKKYKINHPPEEYALYIVYGDQERCLEREEKPLILFKELDRQGRKPMFMLRRTNQDGAGMVSGGGGGGMAQSGGGGGLPLRRGYEPPGGII